jgi:hypothetical protein
MQEVGDANRGVFVFGCPKQSVKGTHFNADSAVHAQAVIDVETVEQLHGAGLATFTTRRGFVFVTFDVDAPVGAATRAEHARRAVLLFQRNHATSADRWVFAFVWVLHRLVRLEQFLHRDPKATGEAVENLFSFVFWGGGQSHDQNTTFKMAVAMMFKSEIGMRYFHAIAWS